MKLWHLVGILIVLALVSGADAAKRAQHGLGLPCYTIETAHFRINYHEGLAPVARRIGVMLEELYVVYSNTYNLVLPGKTEVLVGSDDVNVDDFAYANGNVISLMVNDMDYDLRGSGNYLRDVVAHEFAHVVSIWSALKTPPWMPYMQVGYFSHPNSFNVSRDAGFRTEALHAIAFENLPPWFFEGIAQFESTRNGGDAWDTHRDMIMRTLVLTNKMITWDHMAAFTGKADDFEKTYNHGFSLVRYINDTYGYAKIVSILRESSKFTRVNFDRSIKAVLGISARQLYRNWKTSLAAHYRTQLDSIGTQVYGHKLNKDGFENHWPRFAPDDKKVYFVSNGKNDYSYSTMGLYSYNLVDTVKEKKRIKPEPIAVQSFYSICDSSGLVAFSSMKSPKSNMPYRLGGGRVRDIFLDSLPPAKHVWFRKSRERQATRKWSLFSAAWSPSGNRLAAAHHDYDRFFLCLLDTAGKDVRIVYPDTADTQHAIQTIYSIDWSPDGHRIALSYVLMKGDRKIGIYDTLDHSFRTVCDTKYDERDPRFSHDGKTLYFASDRTGVYNIYRYRFETNTVERVTNVSGGAFEPDISKDEKRLTYVNYDTAGYGVYLIDSVKALTRDTLHATPQDTLAAPLATPAVSFSAPERYSRMPRDLQLIPTFLTEQAVTQENNVYEGKSVFKGGVVAFIADPLDWWEKGNALSLIFLVEPDKLLQFFDDKNIINPKVSYDVGARFTSKALPYRLQLVLDYYQRGIAGNDIFYSASGELDHLQYSLSPGAVTAGIGRNWADLLKAALWTSLYGSYDWYRIRLFLQEEPRSAFKYDAEQGWRMGANISLTQEKRDSKSFISPRPLAIKLGWDYRNQRLQNEKERFDSDWHVVYDDYQYNQLSGSLRYGISAPWYKKHHFNLYGYGTSVELTQACRDHLSEVGLPQSLPTFYQPVAWLPGYTYYYREHVPGVLQPDSIVDTVLLSGNTVTQWQLSYRFPLWPRPIDRKLGFIYFAQVFGALNVSAGAAWNHVSDAFDFKRDDWLTSIGAEVRLKAFTFNHYPLAFSLRWDRGLDRRAPIGGDRFTLSIAYSFEDLDVLTEPDVYRQPAFGDLTTQR